MTKLGGPAVLRVCYEAGPTGYALYWQLTALGVHCDVIAPTLIPTKAGDRVKTDRKDAAKLARSYRAGDLTPVFVPDAATEALRDLVRAREGAKQDLLRARHRLSKFLRHGRRRPDGMRARTGRHIVWLAQQLFELAALQTCAYRHRPATTGALRQRQLGQPAPVVAIAQTAQTRLCHRYRRMAVQGRSSLFIATTIGRELLGFMWAIGQEIERRVPTTEATRAL